jgi:hypothetical protein
VNLPILQLRRTLRVIHVIPGDLLVDRLAFSITKDERSSKMPRRLDRSPQSLQTTSAFRRSLCAPQLHLLTT